MGLVNQEKTCLARKEWVVKEEAIVEVVMNIHLFKVKNKEYMKK